MCERVSNTQSLKVHTDIHTSRSHKHGVRHTFAHTLQSGPHNSRHVHTSHIYTAPSRSSYAHLQVVVPEASLELIRPRGIEGEDVKVRVPRTTLVGRVLLCARVKVRQSTPNRRVRIGSPPPHTNRKARFRRAIIACVRPHVCVF